MSIFTRLRTYLFHRKIDRIPHTTQRKGLINPSRKICLFFKVSNSNQFASLLRFRTWLIAQEKSIEMILYADKIPDFELPDSMYLLIRKDLNWLFIPKEKVLEALPELEFDLLINLNRTQVDALHYLTVRSRAGLKVGFYPTREKVFDLLIDTPTDGLDRDIALVKETIGQISV